MRYTAKKIGRRRWRVFEGERETDYTIERDSLGFFVHGYLEHFTGLGATLRWLETK